MGKNKQHIKFTIEKEKTYECIGFNMAYLKSGYNPGDKVDVLFQLDENNFMGRRNVQFLIKDVRLSHPKNTSLNQDATELFSKIIPEVSNLYEMNDIDEELICKKLKGKNIEEAYT